MYISNFKGHLLMPNILFQDQENQFVHNQAMAFSGIDYYSEDSGQSPKRFRREAC